MQLRGVLFLAYYPAVAYCKYTLQFYIKQTFLKYVFKNYNFSTSTLKCISNYLHLFILYFKIYFIDFNVILASTFISFFHIFQ